MLQAKVVQKIKTHILCSRTPPPRKPRYLRDNAENFVEPDRLQTIIWRIHIVRWILKATKTHSEYAIFILHYSNGGTNTPQCYVIRMLSLLLFLFFGDPMNLQNREKRGMTVLYYTTE
jgi:hypothetical protein